MTRMIRQRLDYPHPDIGKPARLTLALLDVKEEYVCAQSPATLLDVWLFQWEDLLSQGMHVGAKVQNEFSGEILNFVDDFGMLPPSPSPIQLLCWTADPWKANLSHVRQRLIWKPFQHRE